MHSRPHDLDDLAIGFVWLISILTRYPLDNICSHLVQDTHISSALADVMHLSVTDKECEIFSEGIVSSRYDGPNSALSFSSMILGSISINICLYHINRYPSLLRLLLA